MKQQSKKQRIRQRRKKWKDNEFEARYGYDKQLKVSKYLWQRKKLLIFMAVMLCAMVLSLITEIHWFVNRDSYEVINATYTHSKYEGKRKTRDGKSQEDSYRPIYKYQVDGNEYLFTSDAVSSTESLRPHKVLITYNKQNPEIAHAKAIRMELVVFLLILAVFLVEVVELVGTYYERSTGFTYGGIVNSFVLGICFIFFAVIFAFIIAFEVGYYSVPEALHNHPLICGISIFLVAFGSYVIYDTLPKIRKHRGQRRKGAVQ